MSKIQATDRQSNVHLRGSRLEQAREGSHVRFGLHNVRAITAAVGGAVACFVAVKRFNQWGATSEEVSRALPGDDEVALPSVATTRAVTIHAPSDAVWP